VSRRNLYWLAVQFAAIGLGLAAGVWAWDKIS